MKTCLRGIVFAFIVLGLGATATRIASASCANVTGYMFYDSNRALQIYYTTDVTQKITIPGYATDVFPNTGNTNIAFVIKMSSGVIVFEDPDGCKYGYPMPQAPIGTTTTSTSYTTSTMVPPPVSTTTVALAFTNSTKVSAKITVIVNPGSVASVTAQPSARVTSQVGVLPSASGNSIQVNLVNADGSTTCSSAFPSTQGTLTSSSYINVTATAKGRQMPTCTITHNP